MSIQRIRFNTTATSTGAYTVPINPIELDLHVNTDHQTLDIIDGPAVIQNTYFDNRPYVLKWSRLPYDFTGVTTMIQTLQGYQGDAKYVNFGTADYRVTGTGWSYVRMEDVKVSVHPGGNIKYDIEVILIPDEA